jgi:hypothetical protein
MTNSRHLADHRHDSQKLNAIGIPTVDSQIYTTLIRHPRTAAPDLAGHCGLSTQQVARGLSRLTPAGWSVASPADRPAISRQRPMSHWVNSRPPKRRR